MSGRNYASIILSLLILAAIAFGAYRWADALQRSVFAYQSPLAAVHIPPGEPMAPLTSRVVLIVISGLTRDAARSSSMPNLGALLEAGAAAPMVSRPPTFSPAARTTLMTGVWPDLNNAPLGPSASVDAKPIALEHVFTIANNAGLQTAIAASEDWKIPLSVAPPQTSYYTLQKDAVADGQIAEKSLALIADPQYDLILIHFSQVDAVGRAQGTASTAYLSALQQVDRHLRQIARQVNLSESVLIVTSDHGLLENGRLGGGEPELTELPFVMIGQNVIPGDYSPIRQIDVAPTVAALLGTRLPAATQGRPLIQMMRLDETTRTTSELLLAQQKVAWGETYIAAIGADGLSESVNEDMDMALQAWQEGNQAGARQLAELVTREMLAEMASAKATRIASERFSRLLVTIVVLSVAFILLWIRRVPNSLLRVMAAFIAVGLFYGLYRLGGYTFSPSAIADNETFVDLLVRYAAIGMAVGILLVVISLFFEGERDWLAAVTSVYWYGLLATFLAVLPALLGYWQHGAIVRWYLPNPGLTLLHFVSLAHVVVVAGLAILLPWVIGLAVWGVGIWRARIETRSQELDPMARLRGRR